MPDGSHAPIPTVMQEIIGGLTQPQKTLPAKLFYDREGCRLFTAITQLPEYYVTRVEQSLLAHVAAALTAMPGCALVEFGGSDEDKALVLLDCLRAGAYVPIDIAGPALEAMTARLRVSRPDLAVYPVAADFLQRVELPQAVRAHRMFGFFPGSTIGNLDPATACNFLVQARATLGPNARFLVGVDLQKDLSILLPAYNDAQGVTAAFNLNVLSHLNRDHGADFDVASFAHRAVWNEREGRIEMHLVSSQAQSASVGGMTIGFEAGETIHTENSYKHTVAGFTALAASAGWSSRQVWTDRDCLFSLHLLQTGDQP